MLSVKKRRAAHALARGHKVARAAEIAGCSERSVYRWLKEQEFIGAVVQAESEELERASRRLVGLMDKALDELEVLLDSRDVVQRRLAINMVLTHTNKLRELVTLENRVSELERRIYEHR